ncbi:class I SAM-dependent methyltransferase [candidate division KSB1 bacterium]
MKKPLFLGSKFFPKKEENLMGTVDDVSASRENFISDRPNNLNFLLEKRYAWINDIISNEEKGIEVGCGNGLSKLFLSDKNYLLTDNSNYPWIDRKIDALHIPLCDASLDYIISSNMIHHLAKPYIFFNECSRVLKPGGKLIIQEINNSLFLRLILRIMRHEGYSYEVDPFDENSICNDPDDLWSGNNAIPNLLFDHMKKFENHFKYKCIFQKHTEFLIFPLSGGVTAKTKTIQLPLSILKLIHGIDRFLIRISKNTFALQRKIVLEKIG